MLGPTILHHLHEPLRYVSQVWSTCAHGAGVIAGLVPLGPNSLADFVPLNEILADLVPPKPIKNSSISRKCCAVI